MKRCLALLLLSLVGCPQPSGSAADQGTSPPDLSIHSGTDLSSPPADLFSPPIDMAPPGDAAVITAEVFHIAGGLGGPGTADDVGNLARFDGPSGVAFDGANSLYISDANNFAVRKVDLTTGAVTTLAGGSMGSRDGTGAAAQFNGPRGLATDGAGSVYVADSSNHTIRKIVIATGAVTTLAGTAGATGTANGTGMAARFNTPQGLAAPGDGNLYVADSGNHCIRKIDLMTAAVSVFAGTAGVQGTFSVPAGVAAGGDGNLYVADAGNRQVRKVTLAGAVVSTLAGDGLYGTVDGPGDKASFAAMSGITADGAGRLYVSDRDKHLVRMIDIATTNVTTLAGSSGLQGGDDGTGTAARFSTPLGVAADGAGNVYVADSGFASSSVRKLVAATRVVTTFAGATPKYGPLDGTGMAARFVSPQGAVADGKGNLYIADTSAHLIRKIALATGAVTKFFIWGENLGDPRGMVLDGAGNLYYADTYYHVITKVDLGTGAMSIYAGASYKSGHLDGMGMAARLWSPQGLVLADDGYMYFSEAGNHTVRRIELATGMVSTFVGMGGGGLGSYGSTDGTGTAARFYAPDGLAIGSDGNLYVADTNNSTIRKIVRATAAVTTLAGQAGIPGSADAMGTAALFSTPTGLAADGAGNLYVADTGNGLVRRIDLKNAAVSTYAGVRGQRGVKTAMSPLGRFNRPVGLAAAAGVIYVTDRIENAVLGLR